VNRVSGKLVVGISGSPRKGGNTDTLLAALLRGAAVAGVRTEALFLRDYRFSPCIGCEKCRELKTCGTFRDDMQRLYPVLEQADGLVLGSPTHNYNVTAIMKGFIDRLYPYYDFSADRRKWGSRLGGPGKKALVFAVCEQPTPENLGVTLPALALSFRALGFEIFDEWGVTGFFERATVLQDPGVMAAAATRGRKLAEALGKSV